MLILSLCHYYMCVLINICACMCVYSVSKRVTYTHGCDLLILIVCIDVSDNNFYRSCHLSFLCMNNYKSELIIMVIIYLHHT